MAMALVVVVSVAAISRIESGAASEYQRKSNLGSPDLEEGSAPTAPPNNTSTVPDGGSTTTIAPSQVTIVVSGSATSTDKGNKWIASVTVTVTDSATGLPRPSVKVEGSWTGGAGGGASCITQSAGQCPVTLESLTNGTASVTFTVTGVSGEGVVAPSTFPSLTVTKP